MPEDQRDPDVDLSRQVLTAAINQKPMPGKRSKSVDYKQFKLKKYPPLLDDADSSFSDSKSVRMPILPAISVKAKK